MNTTTEMPAGATTTLWYREGNSDKVYQANLEPQDEKWSVTFAYGRRGSTLTTGSKTSAPIEYPEAKRIFDKLVREKTAKGYTPAPDGVPYAHTDKEGRATGILPQLLNPIEQHESLILMRDNEHCAQEKFDGKRVLLLRRGTAIIGINRKGLEIGLPLPIVCCAETLEGDFVIDGECIEDVFHAFDILEWKGENYRLEPYKVRLCALRALVESPPARHIRMVYTAYEARDKQELLERLLLAKREGVVFKRLDAPYSPGRPASGGPQLKHKFYATISVQVEKLNVERSVEIQLRGDNGWQSVGNVAIPANRPMPCVGSVLEVRYLYAFRQSGCLFQPTYLGYRDDQNALDCTTAQLKFKSADEEEA